MSFTDAIRKSLGFEESEGSKNSSSGSNFMDRLKDLTKPQDNYNQQQPRTQQQYNPKPAQILLNHINQLQNQFMTILIILFQNNLYMKLF